MISTVRLVVTVMLAVVIATSLQVEQPICPVLEKAVLFSSIAKEDVVFSSSLLATVEARLVLNAATLSLSLSLC